MAIDETKMFPRKKDIEDAIESLGIHVDACNAVSAMTNAKRVGGLIDLSQSLRKISPAEAMDYHEKSNQIIRKFDDKCSCTFKT